MSFLSLRRQGERSGVRTGVQANEVEVSRMRSKGHHVRATVGAPHVREPHGSPEEDSADDSGRKKVAESLSF